MEVTQLLHQQDMRHRICAWEILPLTRMNLSERVLHKTPFESLGAYYEQSNGFEAEGGRLEKPMNSNLPFIHRFQAMTVVCEVQIYEAADAKNIVAMIESNTRRLEGKYNFYSQSSWLNQSINQRKTSTVILDDESHTVFEVVRRLVDGTRGIFDPTVGTVKSLINKTPELDKSTAYESAKHFMGPKAWSIAEHTLTVPALETQFDLGGVIKEFAVDQALVLLSHLAYHQHWLILVEILGPWVKARWLGV